jgi:hypothetical protein
VNVRYLALDDYVAIAVTGQEAATLVNATDTDLADSALHAPSASFSGEEFYPHFVDKAAVWSCAWPRTTPFPTETSEPPGPHFASSSSSTAGCSTPTPP